MAIVCKSASEIERMRHSGRIVRQVLDQVRSMVAPGVTTMDLERAAEQEDCGTRSQAGVQGILRLSMCAVHVGE